MLAIFPSGATTVGRRGPVRLRARTATGLKGSDCAGMPFAIVLLTLEHQAACTAGANYSVSSCTRIHAHTIRGRAPPPPECLIWATRRA